MYFIFVAKIYDYALIDNFGGFPRRIDSPTNYSTLLWGKICFYLGFPLKQHSLGARISCLIDRVFFCGLELMGSRMIYVGVEQAVCKTRFGSQGMILNGF